jgi:hypothetical protein
MSTAIARVPTGIVPADLNELDRAMIMAERAFGAGAAQKIFIGQAAGLSIGQSLTDVHLMEIGGALKPTLSATAQLALVRTAGARTKWIERSDEAAELEITPPGQEPVRWRVTIDDAARAGWSTGRNKGTWAAHAGAMLRARCITRAIRAECPELLGGMSLYDPDELRADSVDVTVSEPARPAIEQRRPPGVVIDAQAEPAKPAKPAKPSPGVLSIEERRASAVAALCRDGITVQVLEARVGAPVDAWDSVQLTQLGADLRALRRGEVSPADYIAAAMPPDEERDAVDRADLSTTWADTTTEPEPAPAEPAPTTRRRKPAEVAP